MSTNIITGYAGGPHVTSEQQGACNAASFTKGRYVLDVGKKFSYELISNNSLRVNDGLLINQGRFMGIDKNDYEELTIDNGLQGVKRSDLIVIRYEKSPETGIERATMMVVKGTSGDAYVDPNVQTGNILEGDICDDFPLYRIKLNGLTVESVEALFQMRGNLDDVQSISNEEIDEILG